VILHEILDENIGRLMKYLDDTGQAENTIFVFTSDHGYMLGSHGQHTKHLPYEESISVPLVVRWPKGITPGRSSECLFTPMDHMPTLLSMCGIDHGAKLDGKDLGFSCNFYHRLPVFVGCHYSFGIVSRVVG